MADEHAPAIEDYLVEDRKFPPPAGFKEHSLAASTFLYDEADTDYQGFWARQAADLLTWAKDWETICDWQLPFAKWFTGGSLNVAYNCLDRHVEAGRGDKVAFHWEGEPGDTRTITYADLCAEVQRFANALKGLGVQKGDRVNIYMPMIPELPIALLACARIGAPHSVVFGGFSPDSLSDRINDARGEGPDHVGRGMASRPGRPPQGQRRRSARGHALDRARGGRPADRERRAHGARARPLVPRPDGRRCG